MTWRWDNWAGGPGFTTFRMFGDMDNTQTDAAAAAQRALLLSQGPYVPTIVTLSCDTIVKVYADGDGSLVDQRTISTVPTVITGTGAGNFSAVTGSCIVWRTQQSSGRRMLMGRSFMVPLGTTAFTTAGILSATYLNATATALGTYIGRVAANVNAGSALSGQSAVQGELQLDREQSPRDHRSFVIGQEEPLLLCALQVHHPAMRFFE